MRSAFHVERELRLWTQNAILNELSWKEFCSLPNGKPRFNHQELALYQSLRKRLANEIYDTNWRVTLKSDKQNWLTPPFFLDLVRKLGAIALDPCANPCGFVNAWWECYGPNGHIDGLSFRWWIPQGTVCFVNPPYGRALTKWSQKMASDGSTIIRDEGAHLVALIPARTGTSYWESYLWPYADAVCFWNGGTEYASRMRFYELDGRPAPTGATFDAAVVYFGKSRNRFKEIFAPYGRVQLLN